MYSHCRLPRLTIDVEEWQKRKLESEQAAKEATMGKELETIRLMDMGGSAAMMEEKRKLEHVEPAQGGRRRNIWHLLERGAWGLVLAETGIETSLTSWLLYNWYYSHVSSTLAGQCGILGRSFTRCTQVQVHF